MIAYLVRRLALLVLTILVTSFIIFSLTQLLPGDVARLILGREATEARVAQFNADFGLDQPPLMQYTRWLGNFVRGDWGKSFSAGNASVRPLVLERLNNSLLLAAVALVVAVPLSVFLGVMTAVYAGTWFDNLVSILTLAVVGLPEFVTGIVLINVFALGFGWFEATSLIRDGYTLDQWVRVLGLPAITASFVLIGYIVRLTRAGTLEELGKTYVRTAILKGLPRRTVLLRHVLRNALLPTITVIAISIGWLIGGIVVIESIYNYPGMGSELVRAVQQKNLPVLQAITMLIVLIFTLSNLVADLLYAALNPRIRLG
jgi:peptide/nickel transport system permease protein